MVARFFFFLFFLEKGEGFCGTAVIAEESKHGAGADLCGLSLVKQGRANGLEGLDSKVIVVEVRQLGGVTAQVCV